MGEGGIIQREVRKSQPEMIDMVLILAVLGWEENKGGEKKTQTGEQAGDGVGDRRKKSTFPVRTKKRLTLKGTGEREGGGRKSKPRGRLPYVVEQQRKLK